MLSPKEAARDLCYALRDAGLLAEDGNTDNKARQAMLPIIEKLAAPLSLLGSGDAAAEALSQPVYAPGGVEVSVEEMLKKLEGAALRSYHMRGDEAYNYLYGTVQYCTQVLRKQLTPAGLALSAAASTGGGAEPLLVNDAERRYLQEIHETLPVSMSDFLHVVLKRAAAPQHLVVGGDAAGQWISVDERLPEERQGGQWPAYDRVLVARPGHDTAIGYLDNGGWYVEGEDYDGDALLDNTVTHWQPIPKAPADAS